MDIQELLRVFLKEAGYEVTSASDGIEAMDLFAKNKYDLILLDIMLSKIDGFGVCELIRKQSQVPIIMLTALGGEEEQIRGLGGQTQEEGHKIIAYQNLLLDLDNYTAMVDGTAYELTQREFEVLRELLTHQGRIMTRQNLLDKLWRYDFYGDERVVDTHIKNLRKKLGVEFIQTVRGVGYKIDKES